MKSSEFVVEILTREFPPFVYGGAGVHAEELSKVLRGQLGENNVRVRCFDGRRTIEFGGDVETAGENSRNDLASAIPWVFGYSVDKVMQNANPALATMSVDLAIANDCTDANIVHSHTWYANFAGMMAKKLHGVPHIITAHSLEPLRPWKAEQLGGGYTVSSWIEKEAYMDADAVIAVSLGMKNDIIRCYPEIDEKKIFVVHNGIDLNSFSKQEGVLESDVLERYGINPDLPTATFIGRITRQKGLPHLLKALKLVDKGVQIVLCAGAPDTKEIAQEVNELVEELKNERGNVILISEMLPKNELVEVLEASDCFLCPSIYEPLGIVNLEAMAMSLPVVATRTGGIPEVVQNGETGILVDIEQKTDGTGQPLNPEKFESDFASAVNQIFSDLSVAKKMGEAGFMRAKEHFSWEKIGAETAKIYEAVLSKYEK